MAALPDDCLDFDFDFDSELEPAPPAFYAVFGWTRRTRVDRDYVDELQAWADGFDSQPRWDAGPPGADTPLDVALRVDLAAGEYFRGSWRRRLADAQGDCGYVARQMRKAGVPLDLALAVLLMPQALLQAALESSLAPTPRADSRQGLAALGERQRSGSPWLGHTLREAWCDEDQNARSALGAQALCSSRQRMYFSVATDPAQMPATAMNDPMAGVDRPEIPWSTVQPNPVTPAKTVSTAPMG